MADHLVADGYKALGYEYVNIDDCWSEMQRDSQHRLVADKHRFPKGIKELADYMHSKGLKLGIYGDVGAKTCAGYPAQNGPKDDGDYYDIDAQTFAEWGVDSFKFDGCNENTAKFDTLYPKMERALNKTGRKILYSCEWPLYKRDSNYDAVAKTCNLYRNTGDIRASYSTIMGVVDNYATNQVNFAKHNGPGMWIDPDMVVVGMDGLNHDESRTHFAMWAIWSSPLLMSNDLRSIKPEMKEILQNKEVIAVNQDKLGIFGKRVHKETDFEVWVKQMTPIVEGEHSYAIAFLNRNSNTKGNHSVQLSQLLPDSKNANGFTVHDLMDKSTDVMSGLKLSDHLQLSVNPHGVRLLKLVPK